MPLPTLAAILIAAAPTAAPPSSWVSAVSTLVKVRPGEAPSGHLEVRLRAARGACEGFQLVARPPARRVQAEPAPLSGPAAGLTIALYREAFIRVTTPSNSGGGSGLWPDPLLPLEDAEGRRLSKAMPHDSTEEEPLVLYGEVCVPKRTAAGRYHGAVALTAEGRPAARVPVTLDVEPFSIPATSSLPNTFGLSLYSIAHGHGLAAESREAHLLLHAYAAQMLEHRLSAHGMSYDPVPARFPGGGKAQLDFRAYDAEMGPFLSGTALPSGARFTTADVRDDPRLPGEAERIAYYRAFREHFAARRWPQVLFFYAKDEPRPEDRPLVLAQSRSVRAAGGISVLVTSSLDEQLKAATDIFCPVLNCFFPKAGPSTCAHLQTAAELRRHIPPSAHVWWYQSCMSHGCGPLPPGDARLEAAFRGWASYMVDHPVPLNRAMGPLAYLAGVGGELYFDVVSAYDDKDPWSDVFKFHGNGDGTLFYPGTPAKLGGRTHLPVASLRLKAIRDGLQDYEYLEALERAGEKPFARAAVQKLVRSGYDITLDPAVWEETRNTMLDHLRAHATAPLPGPARGAP